jgi:hypothetical protein
MEERVWSEIVDGQQWDCRASLPPAFAELSAAAVLAAADKPDHILRDDRRSCVLLFDRFPGFSANEAVPKGRWVLKRPRWKDERRINQLTTLYRKGEARQVHERSAAMEAIGFPVAYSALLMERRSLGMVVESWLVYRYLEGEVASVEDGHKVIALLEILHRAGWRHRDPHIANWIRQADGSLAALDMNPRRRRFFMPDAAYDFVLLRNCLPALQASLPLVGSLSWQLAEFRNSIVQKWRQFKRRLRGK